MLGCAGGRQKQRKPVAQGGDFWEWGNFGHELSLVARVLDPARNPAEIRSSKISEYHHRYKDFIAFFCKQGIVTTNSTDVCLCKSMGKKRRKKNV